MVRAREREREREGLFSRGYEEQYKKKLEKLHSWTVQLEVELWYFSHVGREILHFDGMKVALNVIENIS